MLITREEALHMLDLDGAFTPDQVDEAVTQRRAPLEQRIASAPTEALKENYRRQLAALDAAKMALLGGSVAWVAEGSSLSQTMLNDLPVANASDTQIDDVQQSAKRAGILESGQTLGNGRYQIVEQIGAGGMGAVYRAFDKYRDKDIAIKVLLPSLVSHGKAKERFLQEARLSSEMSHPHIVTVFDVQQDGPHVFLTMELLKGQTLRQYLNTLKKRHKTMAVDEAMHVIDHVCQGLAYAHDKGAVHRDIKPENIWLTETGQAKVMDFGIARLISTTQMTQTQMAIGTAYYMAPEQLQGLADIDGRADQYAVAIMLYEMLTGNVPTGRIESLHLARRDIPKKLSLAVDRAMFAKRQQRFLNLREFQSGIQGRFATKDRSYTGIAWLIVSLVGLPVLLIMLAEFADIKTQSVATPIPNPTVALLKKVNGEFQGLSPGQSFRDCPDCPEMVVIPAGRFNMGSPASEKGRADDEGPQHSVTIEHPFALGRYEVTRGDYRRFVEATGRAALTCQSWDGKQLSDIKGTSYLKPGPGNIKQTDQHPVICVSHNDAEAYAQWLSQKTGKRYRLPTEAEWEYAARAGTQAARYWGDEDKAACQYANVADKTGLKAGWQFSGSFACSDGYEATAPVGSMRANGFGLYDMLGNVFEWTCNAAYDYTTSDHGGETTCTNDASSLRVYRGGAWHGAPAYVRSANRSRASPSVRFFYLGFRLAQDP